MISDKKQKIFYLITKGSPFGGAQRYVFDLATRLPKDKFSVKVAAGEGGALAEKLAQAGVDTISIKGLQRDLGVLSDLRALWILIRLFRRERPDIIHLNSSKIGLLGSIAGRLAGVPRIIFTAHNWAFNELRPLWQKTAIKLLHWLSVLLCHQVIAVSERTRDELAYYPGLAERFCVIHNGLEPEDYLEKAAARKELADRIWDKTYDPARLSQTLIIGTISELHKNKGLDSLIIALAGIKDKLDHALIWIIGDGELKERLQKLIRDFGLKEHVFLLGQIDHAAKYLKGFDIFTLTSRTEAFPYALLEAGAAGLPVIASAVGGIPEIVSDFKLGLLTRPGNLKELRLALSRLIDNPADRQKFGENLQKKVSRDFSVDKMMRETIKLYKVAG